MRKAIKSTQEAEAFDPATHFDTAPELAERAYNRPRLKTLKESIVTGPSDAKSLRKAMKAGAKQYQELSDRVDRMGKLASAREHQQTQKNLMVSTVCAAVLFCSSPSCACLHHDQQGKGRKRKVRDGEGGRPAVYKWKQKRTK